MHPLIKKLARRVSASRSFEPILRTLEWRGDKHAQLRVLAYHRVDSAQPDDPHYPGLISCAPDAFEQQIKTVGERYAFCSLEQVLEAAGGRQPLPSNAVLLTFDDATVDFEANVWPVLRRYNAPATLFVATAYPDQHQRHFWWDRLHRAVMFSPPSTILTGPEQTSVRLEDRTQRVRVYRQFRDWLKSLPHQQFEQALQSICIAADVPDPEHNNVMSWDTLRSLADDGVTLAPHTHTHPMLNQLAADEVAEEVRKSIEVLQTEVGHAPRTLAYPAGGFDDRVVETMAKEGLDLAFTTRRGVNDQHFSDPLRLKRINVGGATTPAILRVQLANWGR